MQPCELNIAQMPFDLDALSASQPLHREGQIPNILGDNLCWESDMGFLKVRDFNTFETIGRVPIVCDADLERSLAWLREKQPEWDAMGIRNRCQVLARAGRKLLNWVELDELIAAAGWFSPDVVREDIISTANWMMRSEEYFAWAVGDERVEQDVIEGVGVVGLVCTSTMFQTGSLPIKDILSAGNAILVKNDSRNVYPQYLLARALWEEGAPVQLVNMDTAANPDQGRRYLIDGTDKLIFMGYRRKVLEMAYGDLIKRYESQTGADKKMVEAFVNSLLMPGDDIITFVAHIGADYMHMDADVSAACRSRARDAFCHPRACKRDAFSFTHPQVHSLALTELVAETDRLYRDGHIVPPNRKYYAKFVEPYIRRALEFGNLVYGDLKAGKPIIIEAQADALEDEKFLDLLASECLGQVHIVCQGDETAAIRVGREVAARQRRGRILEYSVHHTDPGVFERIRQSRISCAFHSNEGTTDVFGLNQFRRHEGLVLAAEVAMINHH